MDDGGMIAAACLEGEQYYFHSIKYGCIFCSRLEDKTKPTNTTVSIGPDTIKQKRAASNIWKIYFQ